MANEVKLPRLGQGMEAGTITKWLKSPGDTVEKGEPLFEIDTDKVTQEVESDYAGVLLKITLEAGEAPVGQTIAYIGKEGEEVAEAEAPSEAEETEEPEDTGAERAPRSPRRRSSASRSARRDAAPRPRPPSASSRRRAHPRTAGASRPRRSRAAWRVSVGSTSRG